MNMSLQKIAILILSLVLAAGADASVFGADLLGVGGDNRVREVASLGESTERHLPSDISPTSWTLYPATFDEDQGDQVVVRQVVVEDVKTVKIANLVPAIHFGEGEAEIPADYLERLRQILESMRDRSNVRLYFVGHADSLPLSNALQAIYGDNIGLSRERAGTVAEYCQVALNLPPEAISYEGVGDIRPIASNTTEGGRALNRRVEVEVWYDEIGEKTVEVEEVIPREVNRIKVCRSETVCKLRYKDGHVHRARVKNLIAPLHYTDGIVTIPEQFFEQVRQAQVNLSHKDNLLIKIIAYSDNTPLVGRQERIYGNALGLSKAIARRVALAVQDVLKLPNTAIESEGKGATRPVTSNDTPQGRALNRRIELEFWHDDPLQDLPDEPQLCPDAAGAETVTRVYDPLQGSTDPILFENGNPVVSAGTIERLRQAMSEIADKNNVRLRFIGYISNERLDRRTAAIYGDEIGWSTVRARRALVAVSEKMGLPEDKAEFEGRGYVQSSDLVKTGFIESDLSRVEVQVVYDDLVLLDDYEGVEITRLEREVKTENPFGLNLMRITVDGKPVDDPGKSIPDLQRCIDVALDKAQVRFKHDSLKLEPRLNVTAWPRVIRYRDVEETEFVEDQVEFRLYTNYRSFIARAEVRVFDDQQSVRDTPLASIEMDNDGFAQWQPDFTSYSAPGRILKYVVRVYDENGFYDETRPQPLWVVDQIDPVVVMLDPQVELLAGYGESRIASRNIPLSGGTVQVHGKEIPEGHGVWLAGHPVPVDDKGNFIAEEILPEGLHTVEVAVLDQSGNGDLFLRDLGLDKSDWFTVGIADMSVIANDTSGPAKLLSGDNENYVEDSSLQGRLAFFSNGKFDNGWSLTASADTREGTLDDIFSNFMDKTPESMFRRMDPDRHYPTFGDDSTVEEMAPTSGKFFVKMEKDTTYGLWGNFNVDYTDNDLAQVDRDLYGANLHYQTRDTTGFGEARLLLDGFAADPGTVASRDEFLGTGGSLFYLRQQDVLQGSERVRIEVRDKVSGIVLGVKNLTAELDYDIDYIQGRLLLSQALPTTAGDNLLVSTDSISGNPVYLVVRYEFTPGFSDLNTTATGGRIHYWFNDHVKLGVTGNFEDEEDIENRLGGVDVTLRQSTATWLKLEAGQTKGPGDITSSTDDGGYSFSDVNEFDDQEIKAKAYRVDGSVDASDLVGRWRGRATFYLQDLEKGYSAPGEYTAADLTQYGGTMDLPVAESWNAHLKVDMLVQDQGLETQTGEVDIDYLLNKNWTLSSGVRTENRQDNSETVSSDQEQGDRTDGVFRVSYDTHARWAAYGFVQETLHSTGNRDDNGRVGIGGHWRLTDRLNVNGEISTGDFGTGASLGTEFLYSDRSTMYVNYTMENERTDNGLLARRGNMTSGVRSRYSDSASVYLEEQYTHGDVPSGLVHSAGVKLTPTDRLNLNASVDFGTLQDPYTLAELDRKAVSASLGYGFDRLSVASGIEFRRDVTTQATERDSKRTTWLFKNSFKFQLTPDWRIVGKLNISTSDSSLGDNYDGDYTEAVLGYAYRPVEFDRLNVLFKYTYFLNEPASEQNSSTDTNYIQRTHIAAVDAMYDLTSRWTIGGKYAYRFGQVALNRGNNPDFFDSSAHLYVIRADWHFIHRWDALVEARKLDLTDAKDSRSGVLIALYRHFGNNFKAGVGYNFCDFSDDLTDMDYRRQGVFVNLIGKL